MTINLFLFRERRAILIGGVQLVLGKTKKKELNVLASKTYAVQHLQDCNCAKKIPTKRFLWECVCCTENIHLIFAQEGKLNNEVWSSFACYPKKGNISKYRVF